MYAPILKIRLEEQDELDPEERVKELVTDLGEKFKEEGLTDYCVIVFKKDAKLFDLFKRN